MLAQGNVGFLSSFSPSHGQEGAHGAGGYQDRRELRELGGVQSSALSAVGVPFEIPQGGSGVGSATLVQPEPIGDTEAALFGGEAASARAKDDPFSELVAQGAEAFLLSMEAAAIGVGEEDAVAAEDWFEATCAMMPSPEQLDGASR